MSATELVSVAASKAHVEVRLRRADRLQMAMVVQCPDDLVSASHPVRMVLAVVEKLDLSRFHESIKARQVSAGRFPAQPYPKVFRNQSTRRSRE